MCATGSLSTKDLACKVTLAARVAKAHIHRKRPHTSPHFVTTSLATLCPHQRLFDYRKGTIHQPSPSQQPASSSLKQPPRWLHHPISTSFGFVGKLVTVSNLPGAHGKAQSSALHLRGVVSEETIVERVKKLRSAKEEGKLEGFAQGSVGNQSGAQETWKALLSLFRSRVLSLAHTPTLLALRTPTAPSHAFPTLHVLARPSLALPPRLAYSHHIPSPFAHPHHPPSHAFPTLHTLALAPTCPLPPSPSLPSVLPHLMFGTCIT
ncbi:hypothetical protein OG21DRAFT_1491194 [Imleria badia]|nr:hypothetical protein OG21DRAFT_1491194 [Imleria badia]